MDIVRFLAATAVAFYHLGYKPWAGTDDVLERHLSSTPILPFGWQATWMGWIGVQVFFVLSGVVIAYSSTGASPFRFLRGRIARLVPAMWIACAICAAVMIGAGYRFGDIALPLGKSAAFYPFGPYLAGQFWTLNVEIAFYALIFCLLLVGRLRWLGGLAYVLAGASFAYWTALTFGGVDDTFSRITALLLLQHGGYFALGLTLYLAWKTGWTPGRGLLVLVCAATALMQIDRATVYEHLGHGLAHQYAAPFVVWAAACLAIWGAMRWNAQVSHALAKHADLVRLAGLATYPLYLVHWHVGGAAMVAASRLGAPAVAAVLAGFLASLAVSVVIVKLLEPGLRHVLLGALDMIADRVPAARPSPVGRRRAQAWRRRRGPRHVPGGPGAGLPLT